MGQKKEECVRVIMRCRPMAQKEKDAGHKSIIEVDQKRCEVITTYIVLRICETFKCRILLMNTK